MRILRHTAVIPAPSGRLFTLLEDPRAADQINPGFLRVVVDGSSWLPRVGDRIQRRLTFRGIGFELSTEIAEYRRGYFVLERQIEGPFHSFEHALSLEDRDDGTQVTEVLAYEVRLGRMGRLFDRLALSRDLDRLLSHRAQRLAEVFGS